MDSAGIDEFDKNISNMFDVGQTAQSSGFKKSRYKKPKKWAGVQRSQVKFSNAKKAALEIGHDLLDGNNYYCLLSGNFIVADFFEALIIENDIKDIDISISTLSIDGGVIEALHNFSHRTKTFNLLASDYWYAHNKRDLKYVYEALDDGATDFQFSIAACHTKEVLIRFSDGRKLVCTGSANLRSSACVEFIMIVWDDELYDFLLSNHMRIREKYYTINKDAPRLNPKALKTYDVKEKEKNENSNFRNRKR